MKNILKYTAAAALVLFLAACEEFEDHTRTVNGTSSKLAYVNVGTDNFLTTRVMHRRTGSTGEFSTEFAVNCNTPVHAEARVTLSYDASLVESYNAEKGTSYAVLPEQYVVLENATLPLPENAIRTEELVTVSLSVEADLTQLTERYYLAPLRLSAEGLGASEELGAVYLLVETEKNLIRPITSATDMVGFPGTGRAGWSADCDDYASLFDGSSSTGVRFSSVSTVTIDMMRGRKITGLHLYTYQFSSLTIEYSADGLNWETAGTPDAGDVIAPTSAWRAGDYYVAFDNYLESTGYIEATYLRLTFDYSNSYYPYLLEVEAYEIESDDPTVYTVCGTDNLVTGYITHHMTAGTFGSLNASFGVSVTEASASGYSVSAVQDNTLIAAYNRANGTSYAEMPAANVVITGSPCAIAANETSSASEISVSLTGDLSGLTNANGYLIPVKLSASGAASSETRGVVYVELVVSQSAEVFQKNFSPSSIVGTLVSDRSAWTIIECGTEKYPDNADIADAYMLLFDGDGGTYIRTWGGPITFTVDMGRAYDMTGFVITARTDAYSQYQPSSIVVECSTDNVTYEALGTISTADGNLVSSVPSSYASLYDSKSVRYLRINASYGGNMGTGEFNIYAK